MPSSNFLHVKGNQIVNTAQQRVTLRGVCLGGWLNMENFITGYPGTESGAREAVRAVLGDEKARFFFERFLDYFITADDLRYLYSLGLNTIRVPFNYRHFESDDKPFEYKPQGFAYLDRVIGWAREIGLYVILDLHAAPGYQNRGWHCDNPGQEPAFWQHRFFQDRAVSLWEELARRYKGEATVAGYNLLNEPDADDVSTLCAFYRRATQAIRAIDTDHIIFIEGNRYSQQFEVLDPPEDPNTVYSSHNYVEPLMTSGQYPGVVNGETFDRARLERDYVARASFMLRHQVPSWVGEFGEIFNDRTHDETALAVVRDMVSIIEQYGHHWTTWTYKDIGRMGLVVVHPDSPWMQRTRPVREAKTFLRCDSWIERHESPVEPLIREMAGLVQQSVPSYPYDADALANGMTMTIHDAFLSRYLLPAYAEQFRGMNETEIDTMMQSFQFKNCVPRAALAEILKQRTVNVI